MHELIMGGKKKGSASGWTFDPTFKSADVTLSDNNLRASITPYGGAVLGTIGYNTGKRYFEVKSTQFERGDVGALIGFSNRSGNALFQIWASNTNQVVWYSWGGGQIIYRGDARSGMNPTFNQGDVIGVGLDFVAGTFEFFANGVSRGKRNLLDYIMSVSALLYPAVGSPYTTANPSSLTEIPLELKYLPAGYDPW